MKLAHVILLAMAAALTASAQSWDSSGNGMLKGTYYFREVAYSVSDYYADLQEATTVYGNIAFDGNGNYKLTAATIYDSQYGGGTAPITAAGTYVISASGYGYISSPLTIFFGQTFGNVYGLVSQQGIFVGSASEAYSDLFIAAPAATAANASTFKGSYSIADMDLSGGQPIYTIGSSFQLNPDGAGNLGGFTVSGYIGTSTTATSQPVAAVKYTVSNGAVVLPLASPANATLIAGTKYLYISPDGNFVFGGSPTSWDFLVGVRTGSGTPTFSGLYYQAGIDEIPEVSFDTYYGSFSALGGGQLVQHQRQLYVSADGSYGPLGYTYADTFTPGANGMSSTSAMKYALSADGTVRVGSGIGPALGINVALAAPNITAASGVYIYPQAISNAVSYAPFTAGVSPGELVTLAGQNLADSPQIASTFPLPNKLGNAQVMVNGLAAPIYSVYFYSSYETISFLIPYEISSASLASIQVVHGSASNTVTLPVNATTPGVFTFEQNGVGDASASHLDYTYVNSASPALPGETIQVFVTGLGAVNPLVQDGAVAPATTLNNTTNTFYAYMNGEAATVVFAGLAPGEAALYQMDVTIPSDLTPATYYLDIAGPDSYASEATVVVGSATSSAQIRPAAHPRGPMRPLKGPKFRSAADQR